MSSFHADVRIAIYDSIVAHQSAPSVEAVARRLGAGVAETEEAFRALAADRVIVLGSGTLDVAWAPPFAVMATAFRSRVGAAARHAPCAWDAFGIPAALAASSAVIDAQCAWSGQALDCGIQNGQARGHAIVHLLVPAARFWDDIFYT